MPRIRVEWLAIRTQEQRLDLANRITDAVMDVAGVGREGVTVVFEEVDPDLMIKGGVTWTERLTQKDRT